MSLFDAVRQLLADACAGAEVIITADAEDESGETLIVEVWGEDPDADTEEFTPRLRVAIGNITDDQALADALHYACGAVRA